MSIEFGRLYPILRFFSEEKAREFYVDFLGCAVEWEHRFEPSYPLFMQVERGNLVLRLSEHHGDGSPGAHLTIESRAKPLKQVALTYLPVFCSELVKSILNLVTAWSSASTSDFGYPFFPALASRVLSCSKRFLYWPAFSAFSQPFV
jgi:hypothetical protein